jgi:RecA-family ATPase
MDRDYKALIEPNLTLRKTGSEGRHYYDCPNCTIKDGTGMLVVTWDIDQFICNHGNSCGFSGNLYQLADKLGLLKKYIKTPYKKKPQKMSYEDTVKKEIEKVEPKYTLLKNIEVRPFHKTDMTPEIQRLTMIQALFNPDQEFFCCYDGEYVKPAMKVSYEQMTICEAIPLTHFKLNCANKDVEVTNFKYGLLESDDIPITEQWDIIHKLHLPVASIVWTGNKSLHAIIKIDAPNEEEYTKRVALVYEVAAAVGLPPDKQCKNPTRYTRLAGSINNKTNQYQELMALNIGASSWADWEINTLPALKTDVQKKVDDMLVAELFKGALAYDYNQIEDKAEIVGGLIQDGKIFCIGGASKAGKSLLTSRLAMCLSQGEDFFEHKCMVRKVLYFDTELDPDDFKRRQDVIRQNENLKIILAKTIEHKPDETQLERIKRYLLMLKVAAKRHNFNVIVIDCIYKFINENDVKEVTTFVTAIEELKREGYCVIVVHHTNKAKYEGGEPINHLAGHSNLGRSVDGCMLLLETNTMHEFPDGSRAKHYQIYYTLRSFDLPESKVVYINKKRRHAIDEKETQIQFAKTQRATSNSEGRQKIELEQIKKITPMHEENAMCLKEYIAQMAALCGLTDLTIKKKRIPIWEDEGYIKIYGNQKNRRVYMGDKLFGESARYMQNKVDNDDLDVALNEF